MRVCVIRIICDRLKNFRFGFLLPSFLAGRDAEVIMSGGAAWINLDRLA
jgi:hypothetical protein